MSSILKCIVTACIFLMLAGPAWIKAAPQGYLEGHLKVVFLRAVERSDNMPRPAAAPENYAEYPLIISSQSGRKEIARITADKDGNYRVGLPPGGYVLDVQDLATRRGRAKSQPFTVVSNETVRVDLSIFIGFAKGKASGSD